jgi:hypothetical protein
MNIFRKPINFGTLLADIPQLMKPFGERHKAMLASWTSRCVPAATQPVPKSVRAPSAPANSNEQSPRVYLSKWRSGRRHASQPACTSVGMLREGP